MHMRTDGLDPQIPLVRLERPQARVAVGGECRDAVDEAGVLFFVICDR